MKARRELVLDTDVRTFWFAIFALLGCAALAISEMYRVVKLRASPHGTSWQTYLGFAYGLLVFAAVRGEQKIVRAARFAMGLLLLVMGIPIAVTVLHLSTETARALSLWSHLTSAILYGGIVVFLIVWLKDKFREGKLRSNSHSEAMKKA